MSGRDALTYVEIDVPRCANVYGTLPCGARLPSVDDPVMAHFGGASVLKRGAGLTGAADSKLLTCSFWATLDAAPAAPMFLVAGATALNGTTIRVLASIDAAGRLSFQCYNSAGTLILDQRSAVLPLGRPFHALASFDLSSSSKRHIYIDDASALSLNNTFTNDTIDFTQADWGIGGTPGASDLFTGSAGQLWFAPGVYLDLTVTANRRKFIDGVRNPVSLGASGATPTGASPLLFLANAIASWHTNAGTGGGLTKTGTLSEVDFATGDAKCFNTIRTCQDRNGFVELTETLRFAVATEGLPSDIDCFPFIASHDKIQYTPGTIALGESLGTRASLSVTFGDAKHPDTGAAGDPYLSERGYDAIARGSFWGKFRARHRSLRGRECRLLQGFAGQALADMEIRRFTIDSTDGPSPQGAFTVTAKDLFKQLDDDRAQAPRLSNGYLAADITDVATSAALLPSGIGAEYPASGLLNIGGNEVVSFTRTGDNLTISRGQKNTVAKSHKAQDRCQLVLSFSADVATIIKTLAVDYGGIDPARIPFTEWTDEVNTFLASIYTTDICEPTGVATLINELIQQAALAVWPDDLNNEIRLRVLRAVPTATATFTMENVREGTLKVREQPQKRVSRVTIYYARIDPTKPLSNLDNYRSTASDVDDEAEADYGSVALKTIMSRWIPEGGRAVALTLAGKILGRFRDPPRHLSFGTMRLSQSDIVLGAGYRMEHINLQDATGAPEALPFEVTSLQARPEGFAAEGEEMLWNAPAADATDHQIIIEVNSFNLNVRSLHDALFGAPVEGDVITCTILAGVIVGSHSRSLPAIDIGSWPAGIVPNLVVLGRAQGAGGYGGSGLVAGDPVGGDGGAALKVRVPINLTDASGQIWGGGGGGSGNQTANLGGGGGAGTDAGGGGAGASGYAGQAGTATSGGGGAATGFFSAGNGGGPGLAGTGGTPGAAGAAIDGISYVTTLGSPGDRRGGQIN